MNEYGYTGTGLSSKGFFQSNSNKLNALSCNNQLSQQHPSLTNNDNDDDSFHCECSTDQIKSLLRDSIKTRAITDELISQFNEFQVSSSMTIDNFLKTKDMTLEQMLLIDRLNALNEEVPFSYYHPKCNRYNSEKHLLSHESQLPHDKVNDSHLKTDGLFLLRNCSTYTEINASESPYSADATENESTWKFCLSVRFIDKCYHYRISCVDSCIFSLEGDSRAIHGIDELIKYYYTGHHGMVTALRHSVQNGRPPPGVCQKYGRENLLHRACSENNIDVVKQILELQSLYNEKYACCKESIIPIITVDKNNEPKCCEIQKPCNILIDINEKDANGSTSLHEAAYLGRDDIVKELLKYGAYVTIFDAYGYTPIHRAVQNNHTMTLRLLVSCLGNRLGSVSSNNLQCRNQQSLLSNIQISINNSNLYQLDNKILNSIHMRNPYNLRLPIHQAALHRSLECLKILLEELRSPLAPRDVNDDIPLQLTLLAAVNNYNNFESTVITDKGQHVSNLELSETRDSYNYLFNFNEMTRTENYDKQQWTESEWIHYNIDRNESNRLLQEHAVKIFNRKNKTAHLNEQAVFLIRQSTDNSFDGYILSLCCCQISNNDHSVPSAFKDYDISHYKIARILPTNDAIREWIKSVNPEAQYIYAINDGPYFLSIECLIAYYRYFTDGLAGNLVHAIKSSRLHNTYHRLNEHHNKQVAYSTDNQNEKSISTIVTNNNTANMLTSEIFKLQKPQLNSKRKLDELHKQLPLQDIPSLCHDLAGAVEKYSEGNGKHLHLINVNRVRAVRLLGEGEFGCVWEGKYTDDREGRKEFLREALIMSELKHSCVVQIYGIVNDVNLMMIQELLPKGSMLQLCRAHNVSDITSKAWATQIAQGMEYMEAKGFVHRDLAARNVLVASIYQVKVSDFGLSRAMTNNVYSQSTPGRIPIKWYAPEAIEYGRFTSKSDVWSFGVTLWEIFSGGKHPYGDMAGPNVLKMLKQNGRLERPIKCSISTYNLMLSCWNYDEHKRPTFSEINQYFLNNCEFQSAIRLSLPGNEDVLFD
ncbi:hypothetical protein GJ496_010480 [Pomphorhynchus laevis]|nr:hypothetical protein GJ496_010480 [Pomphorhynchus laevis]